MVEFRFQLLKNGVLIEDLEIDRATAKNLLMNIPFYMDDVEETLNQ